MIPLRVPGELRGPLEELLALPLDPGRALRFPLDLAARAGAGLGVVARGPGPSFAAAEELRNKGEVYVVVRGVSLLLRIPDRFPLPLLELTERAYAQGPFRALWAVEGLGHDYAESFFAHDVEPRDLLTAPSTRDLPVESLLMLHAGIGLGLAEEGLEYAIPWTSQERLRRIVARVVDRCRDSSRPGYLGAALESLGLVTGLFHPPQVAAIDEALCAVAPGVRGFYWHGVGRSAYFAPLGFVPGSISRTLEQVRRTAPGPAERRDAVAGLAWGFTLVNQRQPRILEDLVVAPEGEELVADGAFANGVASSVVMRAETTPGAPFIEALCDYRPRRAGELWEELVGRPCRRAVDRYRPTLARAGRLDEVFRYTDLERLVDDLGGALA